MSLSELLELQRCLVHGVSSVTVRGARIICSAVTTLAGGGGEDTHHLVLVVDSDSLLDQLLDHVYVSLGGGPL